MDDKIWYVCDPNKNTTCGKHNCYKRPGAGFRNRCSMTSRRACAVLTRGGKPLRVIVHRTLSGFRYEIRTEEGGQENG